MRKMLGLAAAVTIFVPSMANAANFVETQAQTVDGQNFTFSFVGAPAPVGAGTLDFLVRGDFSTFASLGESFGFSAEGVLTDSGIQANGSNLITNFDINDNLFQVSYVVTLAQLNSLTADNAINISVDYASGVDANLSADPFITTSLSYASAATGAVPEPTTWAMMLLGFGFVGGAMRFGKRMRKVSAAHA